MWRVIPLGGWTTYEINEKGVVRTAKRHRVQVPIRSNGYPSVWLRASKRFPKYKKCCYVHKLVAIMFLEKPENEDEFNAAWYASRQVRHRDHDKMNPVLSNLYFTRPQHVERD